MTTQQIVKWASGFAVGVASLMWAYSTFLTKETHNIYLGNLRSDIHRIEVGQDILIKKVESIEVLIRRQKDMAILIPTITNVINGL